MTPFRLLVPSLAAALLLGAEPVVQAPTAAVWAPVAAALASGSPNAEKLITALTTARPGWVDGWREQARLYLRLDKPVLALDALAKARAIDPNDSECLALQIRALAQAGRPEESYALVTRSAGRDPKGLLRGEAGLVAAAAGDASKATVFLSEAKLRCGPQVPVHLLFLEARIAILNQEYAKAEVVLTSAVSQKPDFIDGWTELGRVRLARVEADPEDDASLSGAEEAFAKAAAGDRRDIGARIGLGRSRLLRADRAQRAGDRNGAQERLRQATLPLEEAVALASGSAEAHALLGEASLRLGHPSKAIIHLEQARTLGLTDRHLSFQLAAALSAAGRGPEAEKLLAGITITDPAEQLVVGLTAYDNQDDVQAYRWLSQCAPALANHASGGAAWRHAGHAALRRSSADTATAAEWRSRAEDAYLAAIALGDRPAHDHLVALASASPADDACRMGWRLLKTEGFLSGDGWRLTAGFAGAAATGGEGFLGAFSHAPVITSLWLLLGLGSLVTGIVLLVKALRPLPMPGLESRGQRSARSATNQGLAPAPRPGLRTRTADGTATAAPLLTPSVKPRRTPEPMVEPAAGADTMMPASFKPPEDDALERR